MLPQLIKFIVVLFEVVVLFNILIIVHELGHFLAARWRGLVVEKFGIWFGKPLWKKTINGVEYSLGCIPAGGFVALPQMAPMDKIEGKSGLEQKDLPPVAPLDKIIVAFAGPLFSFGLALVFATLVWGIGRPIGEREATTTIGYVWKDSPAEKAGLMAGDVIVSVDGEPVTKFSGMGHSVIWRIVRSEGETIEITVRRDGRELTFHPVPQKEATKAWERPSLRQISIAPSETPMIAGVIKDGPAERAGLKPNDLIVALNGEKLYSRVPLMEYIQNNPGQPVRLTLQRQGQLMEQTVIPEPPVGETQPMMGIEFDQVGIMRVVHPSPFEQVAASVDSMISTFGAIFSPKSDIKAQHLSGPVGIMRIYYLLFESEQGWRLALWFSVVFNVNLALLNLLPIPVLDGGHITLAIIEALRRKPVNLQVLEAVQSACALVIIGYMLFITFYDVQDLSLPWKETKKEIRFAPKPH
jgi:regulator of sigma E protease